MKLRPEIELIKQQLEGVEDERLLAVILELLSYAKTRSATLKPFTREEYYKRIEDSLKAVDNGEVIPHEEVINYFKRKRAGE